MYIVRISAGTLTTAGRFTAWRPSLSAQHKDADAQATRLCFEKVWQSAGYHADGFGVLKGR